MNSPAQQQRKENKKKSNNKTPMFPSFNYGIHNIELPKPMLPFELFTYVNLFEVVCAAS
jgi:hypothetical protein